MAPSRFTKEKKAREVTPFRDEAGTGTAAATPASSNAVPPPMRPITPHPDRQPSPENERPVTPAPPPEWSSYDAPMNFTWVIPEELCGMGWPKSRDQVRFLVEQGIDHLVTLSPEKIPPHYAFPNLKHTLIPVEDFTGPTISEIQKFIEITDEARKEGEAVGVHCAEGRGRTGVMCACYLIYYYDMEPWESIRIMRRQRPGSVERKVQEETVVKFYTLLQDYGKSSLEKLEEREKELMFIQKKQQAELIRKEGMLAHQTTMNLLHHMHSFHTKQTTEAKKERVARMRRTKSVPKMEDEEEMNTAVLKSHLQSFLQGEKSNKKRSRSQARVRTDEEDGGAASDSDRRSRCTTPGRSLLEEVSLKPVAGRSLDAKPKPEPEVCELKNHFRDFMRTPATVKRGRSFSQPRDKGGDGAKGGGDGSGLSRNSSFEQKKKAADQERHELATHTKRFLKRKSTMIGVAASANKMASDNDSEDNDFSSCSNNNNDNSNNSHSNNISNSVNSACGISSSGGRGNAPVDSDNHLRRSPSVADSDRASDGDSSYSFSDMDNGDQEPVPAASEDVDAVNYDSHNKNYSNNRVPSSLDNSYTSSVANSAGLVTSKPPPFKTQSATSEVSYSHSCSTSSSVVVESATIYQQRRVRDLNEDKSTEDEEYSYATNKSANSKNSSNGRHLDLEVARFEKATAHRNKIRSKSDVTVPKVYSGWANNNDNNTARNNSAVQEESVAKNRAQESNTCQERGGASVATNYRSMSCYTNEQMASTDVNKDPQEVVTVSTANDHLSKLSLDSSGEVNEALRPRVRRNNLNCTSASAASEYVYITAMQRDAMRAANGNNNYNSRPRPYKSAVVASSTSEDEDEAEEGDVSEDETAEQRRRRSLADRRGDTHYRRASSPGGTATSSLLNNNAESAAGVSRNQISYGQSRHSSAGQLIDDMGDQSHTLDYGRRAFSPPPVLMSTSSTTTAGYMGYSPSQRITDISTPSNNRSSHVTAVSSTSNNTNNNSQSSSTADIVAACKSGLRRLTYRKTYSRSRSIGSSNATALKDTFDSTSTTSNTDTNNNSKSTDRKSSAIMYTQHNSGSRLPNRPTTPGPYLSYDRGAMTPSLYKRPTTPGPFTRDSWKRTNQKFNYSKFLNYSGRETYV